MDTPIDYHGKIFSTVADDLFESLKTLNWVRVANTPRSEYYANDVLVPYSYGSGGFMRSYQVQEWTDTLLSIRSVVESLANCKFETCFLNRYHNQLDHLGWHSDNSPEMDDNRPIAIVSFGVEREIWFRPIESNECTACSGSGYYDTDGSPPCGCCNGTGKGEPVEVYKLKLESGSVCLMNAGMQDTHQHRIPKASFECGERISLTFRGFVQ